MLLVTITTAQGNEWMKESEVEVLEAHPRANEFREPIKGGDLREVAIRELGEVNHGSRVVIRVDTMNMSRAVKHHFESDIDGHERRYILHYGNHRAFLVRHTDKSEIEYDQFGISLIALLRMGLHATIKDRFYTEFINMPTYLDMAPWNIQFSAGSLLYVDKDTMNFTLDIPLQHLYQSMLVSLNYERTVKDFAHCSVPGQKVLYDLPFVGSCIPPPPAKNPCRGNEELPLYCPDGSCRPTYVHCLRALSRYPKKQRRKKSGPNIIVIG